MRLLLVRHGVAQHNSAAGRFETREETMQNVYLSETFFDCALTSRGSDQAVALFPSFVAHHNSSSLIFCSPLTRAIQTCLLAITGAGGAGGGGGGERNSEEQHKVILDESLREVTGLHPCDRRRPRREIEQLWNEHAVDVDATNIPDDDTDTAWNPTKRETLESVQARARTFLRSVARRAMSTETKAAWVFSHGVLLEQMLFAFGGTLLTPSPNADTSWLTNEKWRFMNANIVDVELDVQAALAL